MASQSGVDATGCVEGRIGGPAPAAVKRPALLRWRPLGAQARLRRAGPGSTATPPPDRTEESTMIVRISGEGQYRLDDATIDEAERTGCGRGAALMTRRRSDVALAAMLAKVRSDGEELKDGSWSNPRHPAVQ